MVKYFAMVLALVGTLAIADLAEARGRRGCSSCGGCSGGECYVAPTKTAAVTSDAPPAPVASAPASRPAAVATTTETAPAYYTSSGRRGLFGWRR